MLAVNIIAILSNFKKAEQMLKNDKCELILNRRARFVTDNTKKNSIEFSKWSHGRKHNKLWYAILIHNEQQ